MTTYSDKETEMFKALGLEYLLANLEPSPLYRIAIEEAFMKDLKGKAVESLRRTGKAFADSTVFRRTKEFDALIEL